MKLFVAVVSSVTDYRKEQSVAVDHCSVHQTRADATRAIMTAILRDQPHLLARFPVDLPAMAVGKAERLTRGQRCRLQEYMEKDGEIEDGWEQDDVPQNQDEFGTFEKTETAAIQDLAETVTAFVNTHEEIPFTELTMPALPRGEYVSYPIVWKITETEIGGGEEEDECKKRVKTCHSG